MIHASGKLLEAIWKPVAVLLCDYKLNMDSMLSDVPAHPEYLFMSWVPLCPQCS